MIIISDNTELKIAQDRTQTNKWGLHRKLFYSLIEYNALVATSYFNTDFFVVHFS